MVEVRPEARGGGSYEPRRISALVGRAAPGVFPICATMTSGVTSAAGREMVAQRRDPLTDPLLVPPDSWASWEDNACCPAPLFFRGRSQVAGAFRTSCFLRAAIYLAIAFALRSFVLRAAPTHHRRRSCRRFVRLGSRSSFGLVRELSTFLLHRPGSESAARPSRDESGARPRPSAWLPVLFLVWASRSTPMSFDLRAIDPRGHHARALKKNVSRAAWLPGLCLRFRGRRASWSDD
jgi:hypothetical protein